VGKIALTAIVDQADNST